MTLAEMNKQGFKDTKIDIARFYVMVAEEYKKSLIEINKEIRGIYDKVIGTRSYSDVAKLIKEQPNWLYVQSNKFDRLQTLQKKIQREYTKASIKAGNMTVEASKTAITNNFYRQQFSIAFASDLQLSFSVLNPYVIEMSVLSSKEIWKKLQKNTLNKINQKYGNLAHYQPKHGTLSKVLAKNRKSDIYKISSILTQGLIQGKSYTKTAMDIKTVLNGSISQALRVVRTESNRNMNAGAYASHNVGLDNGVELVRMIIATLDSRTREQSREVDGKKEKDGVFIYPGGVKVEFPGNTGNPAWDINDRETVIETIDGQPPEKRTGRNPITGKNEEMSFKTYPEWLKENDMSKNETGRIILGR